MPPLSTLPNTQCLHCTFRPARAFCNLAPLALAGYDSIRTVAKIASGAVLFREFDPATRVFVLCSGYVKLSCSSKDGKLMNVRIASPGDVLGLSAIISGAPYEVSAEAIEPTVAKIVRRADFLTFLARQGEASLHAAQELADQYKSAFDDARRLALSGTVSARLASLLLDWWHAAPCGSGNMQFTMPLNHDDLAAFTATTRETVSRTLSKFQKDKLVAIHGSSVHVLMPEKLAALCA
jgi:CRP/FNR family transcriptional regulator